MIRLVRRRARPWAPLTLLTLAACSAPVKHQGEAPAPVTPPSPTTMARPPLLAEPAPQPLPATRADVWARLRASFQMDDCSSDPAVMLWARRFTTNPARFQQLLSVSLPRLVYIQSIAEKHGIAGEFVLLPWVESRYQPVRGKGRQPGGMWQIVPATAGSLGLRVTRAFDGRMDIDASTEAVMSMLQRYQSQFHDWRLTDYAYNAGEYSVRKLVARHGMPPAEPTIPKLPVRNVTREHLIKLLAIACVIRSPGRFHVTLPQLPESDHLVAVPLTRPMSMRQAASHAGMPEDTLRQYNSAFLTNRIDPDFSGHLLLPTSQVEQFRQFMQQAPDGPVDDEPVPIAATTDRPRRHKVRNGESLWSIAKHYALSVKQLQRWNHLHGSIVHPGQVLRVSAP